MKRILYLTIAMAAAISCTGKGGEKGAPATIIGAMTAAEAQGSFTPEKMLRLGRVSDPQLSPDGKTILYGVTYTSIEENRGNRELFTIGIDGSGRKQITHTPKGENNAVWIEDGKRIAFIYEGQIHVMNPDGGGRVKISDIEGGVSGFKLSPDGKKVLYISDFKVNKTAEDIYPDIPKSTARTIEGMMYRHWDHFVENIPHTFITDFNTSGIKAGKDLLNGEPFELPTEPFGGIEQLDFSPDGTKIAYSCRKKTGRDYAFSTNTDIYLYDIASGECENLTEGMMGYDTDPLFSPDGKTLAWLSMERDGYEADRVRLFVMDMAGRNRRELSVGFDYNVSGIIWNSASDRLWFYSEIDGQKRLLTADMNGNITRLPLAGGEPCDLGSLQLAPSGNLVATLTRMLRPAELVSLDITGAEVKITPLTHENDELVAVIPDIKVEERWITTTDGKKMHTWVLFPPDFDPANKYPAVLVCLGGPQGAFTQGWSTRWNYRLMASQGYVVILPNRRGTTSSGQAWCEQISGDYPGQNIKDYLSAADALMKEPYVGKMAAVGASYGGYSVYYLAGVHQKRFSAFIAHAGIYNQEQMYMATEEMWFPDWDNGGCKQPGTYMAGSPWSKNPAAVRHYAQSPHKLAQNWDTPILVIHGELDYRVPVDQGMAAFNTAQMMGVPSKMLLFPDENHWILKPQNSVHWHREFYGWIDKYCR